VHRNHTISDPVFHDTPTLDSADFARHTVRLACSGELVAIGSIGLAVSRESALGAVLIEFVCPRCDALHESRLFR
jgi:hypothetical protein